MIFLIFSIIFLKIYSQKTQFVFTVYSNGASAPSKDSVDNTFNEDYFGERWDQPGEITPVGIRQMYILGLKHKELFGNFLSNSYNPNELKIESLDHNLNLMSAEAYLQGLYPPQSGPTLTPYQKNLAFPPGSSNSNSIGDFDIDKLGNSALPNAAQIFSVESFSIEEYKHFYIYDIPSNCKDMYHQLIKNEKSEMTVNEINKIINKFGDNLEKVLGPETKKRLADYTYINRVINAFISGYTEGKLHKRLTDSGINLKEFNTAATEFKFYDHYKVKNLRPLKDGKDGLNGETHDSLFNEAMLSHFGNDLNMYFANIIKYNIDTVSYLKKNKLPPLKMVAWSVDSVLISSILAFLNEKLDTKIYDVPYASSLTFELISVSDDLKINNLNEVYFVKITFNKVEIISIGYTIFTKILDDVWSQIKLRWECSLTPFHFWGYKNATVTLSVILFVLQNLILIFNILICCIPKKKKETKNESNNNDEQI